MKLHDAPRTKARRPRWLLEELGVPYQAVPADMAGRAADAMACQPANPFTEVPVLEDGEVTLHECTAICLYLADRFPERGLAPAPDSPLRGPYLQWMQVAGATLDPLVLEHFWNGQRPAEARRSLEPQRARLEELLAAVERQLEGREVLVGDSFTAADVLMASILHLAGHLGLLDGHTPLREYVVRHTSRPASRRAMAG